MHKLCEEPDLIPDLVSETSLLTLIAQTFQKPDPDDDGKVKFICLEMMCNLAVGSPEVCRKLMQPKYAVLDHCLRCLYLNDEPACMALQTLNNLFVPDLRPTKGFKDDLSQALKELAQRTKCKELLLSMAKLLGDTVFLVHASQAIHVLAEIRTKTSLDPDSLIWVLSKYPPATADDYHLSYRLLQESQCSYKVALQMWLTLSKTDR